MGWFDIGEHFLEKPILHLLYCFLSVDNLERITKADIRKAVSETCALVVCLHDETVLSEVPQYCFLVS